MSLISFIFMPAFPLGTWNTSRSTAISDSSAGPTPRRYQAMQSLHVVLGRPLGCFPVGVASRMCLANLSCDILAAWPNRVKFGGFDVTNNILHSYIGTDAINSVTASLALSDSYLLRLVSPSSSLALLRCSTSQRYVSLRPSSPRLFMWQVKKTVVNI